MAITIYGKGFSLPPPITPSTYIPMDKYSPHGVDFPKYKGTPLYSLADVQLRAIVASNRFIASDIKIKGILSILGSAFSTAYNKYGFSGSCAAMLGMHLFEICVYDPKSWWYKIPKPLRGIGHYEHSEYCL
jgi:hypothetical protein